MAFHSFFHLGMMTLVLLVVAVVLATNVPVVAAQQQLRKKRAPSSRRVRGGAVPQDNVNNDNNFNNDNVYNGRVLKGDDGITDAPSFSPHPTVSPAPSEHKCSKSMKKDNICSEKDGIIIWHTSEPTTQPSDTPTESTSPSIAPSPGPTQLPTSGPTTSPTWKPTLGPTIQPSISSQPTLTECMEFRSFDAIAIYDFCSRFPDGEKCCTTTGDGTGAVDVMQNCNIHGTTFDSFNSLRLCKGSCTGKLACTDISKHSSQGTLDISIGINSCKGQQACNDVALYNEQSIRIGNGSCVGIAACGAVNRVGSLPVIIEDGGCVGDKSCIFMGYYSQGGLIHIGANACFGKNACDHLGVRSKHIVIGSNSCFGSGGGYGYSCAYLGSNNNQSPTNIVVENDACIGDSSAEDPTLVCQQCYSGVTSGQAFVSSSVELIDATSGFNYATHTTVTIPSNQDCTGGKLTIKVTDGWEWNTN